jgi:hypothetical protein
MSIKCNAADKLSDRPKFVSSICNYFNVNVFYFMVSSTTLMGFLFLSVPAHLYTRIVHGSHLYLHTSFFINQETVLNTELTNTSNSRQSVQDS